MSVSQASCATLFALLCSGPLLACASGQGRESASASGACLVQTAADGSLHVASEAHGYALSLPPGFSVDCEVDEASGMMSADYEQPSVGRINVLLMALPGTDVEDGHALLTEQFHEFDSESFGIASEGVQTIAGDRVLRCYGGPAGGEFEASHYYACTSVEPRNGGALLGSVVRIIASNEEWQLNGDASMQMIQALARAWTPSLEPGPDAAAPSRGPTSGCADQLGVDPQAIATACGFGPVLAQARLQTYCELQFSTPTGQPGAVVTLREFRHRDADAAWSLHRLGFGETPGESWAELPGIRGSHWSSFAGYRWAYVPGWTHARRIGWFEADCNPSRMMPVLHAMAGVPQPVSQPAPRWAPSPGVIDNLASHYGARTDLVLGELEQPDARVLPYRAKKLIVMLMAAAARRDEALARSLLSPGAGFGLPDRREFDGWPIAERDNLATLLAALGGVASRFPADAHFTCPPIPPDFEDEIARGEHPMWCSFVSADGLDLLVFRLLAIDGLGYVDYVGMFEAQPTSPLSLPIPELSQARSTEPPIPPLTPNARRELPTPRRAPQEP